MAHPKPSLAILQEQFSQSFWGEYSTRVQPEYVTVVNAHRKFVEVSPAFCKLLGYTREELIGKSYDEVTVPRTNNVPLVLEMFRRLGYMAGIWVFAHRGGTKLFLRYETVMRDDGLYETRLELLGAGA
jgi:PAS domain S-box-containing protein